MVKLLLRLGKLWCDTDRFVFNGLRPCYKTTPMNETQLKNQSASIPSVNTGSIERLANFKSANISPRHIDIWLPENYHADGIAV